MRTWALWRERPRALAVVLGIELIAVLGGVLVGARSLRVDTVSARDLLALGFLVLGIAVHAELGRRSGPVRETDPTDRPSLGLMSMWGFAALLLLPCWLALVLTVGSLAFWWSRLPSPPPPARRAFAAGCATLATVVSWAAMRAVTTALLGAASPRPDLRFPEALLMLGVGVVLRWALSVVPVLVVARSAAPSTLWPRSFSAVRPTLVGLGGLGLGALMAACWTICPPLAALVALPVLTAHRATVLASVSRRARTDAKTGLHTSAHWHAAAGRALSTAQRHRRPVAVLMIDLDHFKRINDTWGHLAGDRALAAVAAALRAELRADDVAGRFGGEEFAVLLHAADRAGAARTAERLRAAVSAVRVPASATGEPTISGLSVSIGTAVPPGDGTRLGELLVRADLALYRAKAEGRNRVVPAA